MLCVRPGNDLVVYFVKEKYSSYITQESQCSFDVTHHLIVSLCRSVLSQPTSYRPRLLLEGRPGSGQNSHLAPAVLHALEKFTVYTLDIAVLFGTSATAPEETCAQVDQISKTNVCIQSHYCKLTDSSWFYYFEFISSQPCQI